MIRMPAVAWWYGTRLCVAAALLLLGCADGRPEAAEAKAWFESRYPGTIVTDIQMSEDEVVARSFQFQYRSREGRSGRLGVQFMQDSAGSWAPRPAAPAALP